MNHNDKIYIAGHNGMAGSAIYKSLVKAGYGRNYLIPNKLAVFAILSIPVSSELN